MFVQDDIDLAAWLSVSAGGRVDQHSEYGTFFSPRLAALVRAPVDEPRCRSASGFFAATPLTEETEAAGLSRLQIARPLEGRTRDAVRPWT